MSKPPQTGAWTSGVFSCFSDIGSCCYGYWCVCCLYGENHEKVNGEGCVLGALIYYLLASFALCALYSKNTRAGLRAKYNLPEEPCGDCLLHCFCSPCAVCQEARELKARGIRSHQEFASAGAGQYAAPVQMQMQPPPAQYGGPPPAAQY